MTQTEAAADKPGKNAFFFVVVAVILNMLSFGIIMPVMPALLEDITGLGAAQSVVYGGWLSMTFAIAN
ncbi:MAG: MFS transporter, partial [Hyphomonas sp.]|nr:MFS transporter [Hyphomonas sp.]